MIKSLKPFTHEVKFQFRHGFYIAYLLITVIYIAILRTLPMDVRTYILPLILFSDQGVVGFFFISGLFFLERDQNTLENLFVTPYSIRAYIINKVAALSLISYFSGLVIAIFTIGKDFSFVLFTTALILTSIFFTLLGFILVVRTKNLNYYMIFSGLFLLVFFLPLLGYLEIYDNITFTIIPTQAAIHLISSSITQINVTKIVLSVGFLIFGCLVAYKAAYKSVESFIVSKIGGGMK